ncbi:SGNH/GDSL hydrolase family protein, partial [Acetobacterium bakii]
TALAEPGAQDIINAALPQLQTNLAAGATQFTTDWPQIIATAKTLAPQAEIYVTTLYDPISPQDPLYAVFDPVIQAMNAVIMTPSAGYQVADVYTAFKTYEGTDPLVNFNWYAGSLDPHPTTAGHALIYQTHLIAQPIE